MRLTQAQVAFEDHVELCGLCQKRIAASKTPCVFGLVLERLAAKRRPRRTK